MNVLQENIIGEGGDSGIAGKYNEGGSGIAGKYNGVVVSGIAGSIMERVCGFAG